jgi:hypothetical protein
MPGAAKTKVPENHAQDDANGLLAAPEGTKASALVGDVNRLAPSTGSANGLGNSLTGYRFDYLQPGRVPVVKILLAQPRAQVQMSKVDPKTYRIVIPGCTLAGTQLALPQFPPADFSGFAMVAAQQLEDRVEITISVDPGTTIGTFVRNNEIWVKRL